MTIRRRLITIPAYFIIWLLWMVTAPVWILLAIATDLARRSDWVALRSGAIVSAYFTCEVIGILASGALWLWRFTGQIKPERWNDLHFRLEAWWGATIFRAIVLLFELRVVVEGDENLANGPYLLLVRHASAGDTLLASTFVGQAHGIRLRYVLKRELLWDPCLDIVGNRLPNVFVDRNSKDSNAEIRKIQELAKELGPQDGVLVYPEGSRFSHAKRRRALVRLEQREDTHALEYAKSLSHVLPPRPGGTLGLLEAAPEADIIICAHTGFEGAASLSEIWNGSLLKRTIRVQFRRIQRDEVPKKREERARWLFEEWKSVNAFIDEHFEPGCAKEEISQSLKTRT
jgi:1-acyl-sn-glycerol-3-phosphate acyltransferase